MYFRCRISEANDRICKGHQNVESNNSKSTNNTTNSTAGSSNTNGKQQMAESVTAAATASSATPAEQPARKKLILPEDAKVMLPVIKVSLSSCFIFSCCLVGILQHQQQHDDTRTLIKTINALKCHNRRCLFTYWLDFRNVAGFPISI